MKELLVCFIREEDGDVVQNVIIIAIMAALALLFGGTIRDFVTTLIDNISSSGTGAADLANEIAGGGEG